LPAVQPGSIVEHTFDGEEVVRMYDDAAGLPALDASLPVSLAMIVAGLDVLTAQAPADTPGPQALAETQVLLVQLDRLKGLVLSRLGDVETRRLHEFDDSPSTAAWVAEQETSTTRSEVALARKLDRVPQVAARILAGGLSIRSGIEISRALGKLRPHVDRPDGLIDGQPGEQILPAVLIDGVRTLVAEAAGGLPDDDLRLVRLDKDLHDIAARPVPQLARLEAAFLALAARVERGLLKDALGQLVDALLPNELAKRADDAHTNRGLELVRDDDGAAWTIRGRLDLECGELLHTALAAAMETDPDNPLDTAAAEALRQQGLDPYQDGCIQVRSRRQRRHDGLTLLLRRLLDSGALGLRGKHVPHIAVTISDTAVHNQPGALPARAASGARWPTALVRRVLCDSALTRYVLSLGHRVLETSHTERTLKPHERRIKQLETGGICQGAGCTRGPHSGHPLIPHHANPYALCGTTSLDDTVLFCAVTHHDLHEGGKTIRLKDGRLLSPTGWVETRAA
jgi:hypothetical protein